jgi:integration host factor subunit beta
MAGGMSQVGDPKPGRMIRSDLVAALRRDHPDLTRRETEEIVTTIFATIAAQLASGGRVELRGFGSFATRTRDARIRRNPKTGKKVAITANRSPVFRPSGRMHDLLNPAPAIDAASG